MLDLFGNAEVVNIVFPFFTDQEFILIEVNGLAAEDGNCNDELACLWVNEKGHLLPSSLLVLGNKASGAFDSKASNRIITGDIAKRREIWNVSIFTLKE